jgi:thiamine biosynthesis lipoprotein
VLLRDGSVSTSGDAEQYVEIGGVRYSHHIDPKTGLGMTVHSSVTVVAPAGIIADGITTAACVMGPDAGMKFLEETPGIAALFAVATKDGQKVYESQRWKAVPKTGPKTDAKKPEAK